MVIIESGFVVQVLCAYFVVVGVLPYEVKE